MKLNIKFPEKSTHDHPFLKNTNDLIEEQKTTGQKAADFVAQIVGSWKFVIIQSIMLTIWIILNLTAWILHWDPYPFILMNLVLSLQAAYTAPIIMMSQNRQNQRDRIEAQLDYQINLKAEKEVMLILENLEEQNKVLLHLVELFNGQNNNSVNE